MGQRAKLQAELQEVLGSANVYFQPPESVKMKYPAIVYEKTTGDSRFADDHSYTFYQAYSVTSIDANPDSETPKKILEHFPMSRYDRSFTSGNLNHEVINLYY